MRNKYKKNITIKIKNNIKEKKNYKTCQGTCTQKFASRKVLKITEPLCITEQELEFCKGMTAREILARIQPYFNASQKLA